ncbi:MAG: hypothetical protein HOP33_14705 [Verrucomicrobia bacterium]|nr:hypothetical protein [Verrucomicrobiota bacterium]
MSESHSAPSTITTVEDIQKNWHDLTLRVGQLEAERKALEQDNKALRFLLERVIEHRQKSHGELVLLLAGLVSKLPINDVGFVVSKLVEHNAHVSEVCCSLGKGNADAALPQPAVLRALDDAKRNLNAALKPAIEELIKLDTSLETRLLQTLAEKPDLFYAPEFARANRCYVKGQVMKERILREFGEHALIFFNDLTTDAKLNPRPKPDEIVLAFKPDFEAWFAENPKYVPDKRTELMALFQKIQRAKGSTDASRLQKVAFAKLSFIVEMIHFYANQNTESPEAVFAQRMPALIEQLGLAGAQEVLDEKAMAQTETLLAYIANLDHRLMAINNVGKAGGLARTLRFVLRFRAEKVGEQNDVIPDFVRHLIPPPPQKPPAPETLTPVLRLMDVDSQKLVVRALKSTDRLKREEAEALARALAVELKLKGVDEEQKPSLSISPEMERQMAWEGIKETIMQRGEPAVIATAIRDRLHAKYDADELKQSWITLCEADVMTFIRAFCQLPYLADGKTDTIARAVMESYVNRLTHEKYAGTYHKVVTSLRNMFRAKPDSPTLLNFIALVRWVDAAAANKLSADVGMPAQA